MTYIVYDGKTLIADKLMRQTIGTNTIGRKPVKKSGYVDFRRAAKGVDVYYNDVSKLIFPENATFNGKKISVVSFAGSVGNTSELLNALAAGVDLDAYTRVEVNIRPNSARRVFNGATSMMVVTEDGEGTVITSNGSHINSSTELPMHLGSGRAAVDGVNPLLDKSMTSLECFVIASNHCDTVSHEFDYYVPATKAYVKDQRLTERQNKQILNKIQARIDLLDTVNKKQYVN
jgi:ATP-dependent protease HslVU (ClpYQ) peptidase subunit